MRRCSAFFAVDLRACRPRETRCSRTACAERSLFAPRTCAISSSYSREARYVPITCCRRAVDCSRTAASSSRRAASSALPGEPESAASAAAGAASAGPAFGGERTRLISESASALRESSSWKATKLDGMFAVHRRVGGGAKNCARRDGFELHRELSCHSDSDRG